MAQGLLDLRPQRAPRFGGHAVDQRVKLALRLLLSTRHRGMENAATWEQLRQELNAEGERVEGGLFVGCVRRLQEAKEELLAEEDPIASTSGGGVCWAIRPEELEASFREADKRARKSFLQRRRARRAWMALRGQVDLGEGG